MPPVFDFVARYTLGANVIVDPFARNSLVGTITNDLNPNTSAEYHLEAGSFLQTLIDKGTKADVVLYDPPYSVRQVAECYSGIGMKATQQDTQSSFYTKIKYQIRQLVKPGGIVLSFGWNSMGVGKSLDSLELLLVFHGGAHNDTICLAQKSPTTLFD